MSTLTVEHLTKRFGAHVALDDVGLEVRAGTVHALLGGNGSGKSTLIKALAGVQPADHGRLRVNGRDTDLRHHTPAWAAAAGLRFVHQSLGIFPGLSVAENLALGCGYARRAGRIDWGAQRTAARRALARFDADLDPDRLAGTLRPADQALVAIARAVGDDAGTSVLVLDEPTASLPRREVDVLFASLRRHRAAGHSIVLVTHRLDEVLELADDVTVLRDGKVVSARPVAGLDHASLVAQIVGADVHRRPVAAHTLPAEADTPVVRLHGVGVAALRNADLAVWPGEVVGIAGLLGSGRSELLEVLAGGRRPERGSMELDGVPFSPGRPADAIASGVVFVPEDRPGAGVFPGESVRRNLHAAAVRHYWRRGRLDGRAERHDARHLVHRFGVRAAHHDVSIDALSGGNQQKVVMARWLRHDPRLVLLDEPTQGIDVHARQEIHGLVRERSRAGAAVLYVSSDFEELAEVCDRVVVIAGGVLEGPGVCAPHVTAGDLVARCYAGASDDLPTGEGTG